MVFKGVSTPGGIAPIVLGDELLQAALRSLRGTGRCLRIEPAPRAVELPPVLHRLGLSIHIDAVPHRKADVVFSIRESGDLCHCPPGNNFGDKNQTSAILVPGIAANVESQVYLVEMGVKRNRKSAKE